MQNWDLTPRGMAGIRLECGRILPKARS